MLAVVGKVDADGTHTYDECLTTGAWVKAVCHQSSGEAARTVRTARALRSGVLPNTVAALAAGALTGRHAAVIADGVKGAPAGAADETTGAAVTAAIDAASPLVTGDQRTAARRRLDGLHRICLELARHRRTPPRLHRPAHQQVQGPPRRHHRPARLHR